jgi:hypothetical protein
MKVNFKELQVYTSIRKDKTEKVDIAEVVADTIYKNVGGVVAHSLALRIYNDGEVELNEKECEIVRMVADGFVGIIADSIKDKLSS